MKINIAGGTGIMGKVHKPVFENAGHEVIISGRKTTLSLEEAAQISDVTIISVPIQVTEETIKRIAPYCSALMDFTGLKIFSTRAMLDYSNTNCEVGGLHPLYGDVPSIKGKTVVYCPTDRSRDKCNAVIESLEKSGAEIKRMDPQSHDLIVGGIAQNARLMLFGAFAGLMEMYGLSAKELYNVSPPPTRVLLDLIARQVDEKNDSLYRDMQKYNPSTREITNYLSIALDASGAEDLAKITRALYGERFLKEAQNRARMLIEESDK